MCIVWVEIADTVERYEMKMHIIFNPQAFYTETDTFTIRRFFESGSDDVFLL